MIFLSRIDYMLEFLEDYEFITSWISLPVDIVFLCLMLWEFKYIRKEQQEKKDKDIEEKIIHLIETCHYVFIKVINPVDSKNTDRIMKLLSLDEDELEKLCKSIKCHCGIPNDFCKKVIEDLVKSFTKSRKAGHLKNGTQINLVYMYNYLSEHAEKARNNPKTSYTLWSINKLRKYFKSDEEIDEIYKKLKNV